MSEKEQLASGPNGPPEKSNPMDFSQTVTLGEILGETAKYVHETWAPGLTWDKLVGDIGHEIGQQWEHGRHELAAALFGHGENDGFVMYARREKNEGREDEHGVHGRDEQQQERGGREM